MKRMILTALLAGLALTACDKKTTNDAPADKAQDAPADKAQDAPKVEVKKTPLEEARVHASVFKALPTDYKLDGQTKELEDLGRMLYFEKRLSKAGDISCNSCHQLDKFGVDGEPTSPGHKGQRGGRNSPTVYNAAGHFAQFWDGRAKDVEEQAKGPILNPIEMAMASADDVVKMLKGTKIYPAAFKAAFPKADDPVTYDNLGKAIGAFERKLVTPSRFDKFLGGDDKALTDTELQGLALFSTSGCAGCHGGALLGGANFQKLGAVKPWPNQKDQGRFEVTKKDADKMMFKPPSLRNIAKTGPYFHDGSVATLDDAVIAMGKHQLGKEFKAEETAKIVAFLGSLTGEVPTDYIKDPHAK